MYINRRVERAVQESGGIFTRVHSSVNALLPGLVFNFLLLLWVVGLVTYWLVVGGKHCGYRYRRKTVGIMNPVKRFLEATALRAIYNEPITPIKEWTKK